MSLLINKDTKAGLVIPYFPSTVKRLAYTPDVGEYVFDSQLQALFVGDGATAGGRLCDSWPAYLSPGIQFEVTGTLTSAAAATPVILLADSLIPSGKAVYINWWMLTVNGGNAWVDVGATIVKIQDNAAVAAITFGKAGLTGNAMLVPGSANTTLAALMVAQSGLTANRGIQIVADAVFGAGSDIKITVGGYIK
jgi:hypothetical protein